MISCHVGQRKFSELSASLDTVVIGQRIPYMGAFELTYRCNQACCHCYCNLGVNDCRRAGEMPSSEIFRLLDEAADAGCLWLLLTGGEVLVREDFAAIYTRAIKKGMLVQVFTNATLIDEAVAELFARFPPLGIDISIYGSCPSVHDKITRVAGSFTRMTAGMNLLKKFKVPFSLKSILMTANLADLGNMRTFSENMGVRFRYDTLISLRIDGGAAPSRYRLGAPEMAGLDLDDNFQACDTMFSDLWNRKHEGVLTCGAGVFAFNINPYGVLSPCTMFKSFQYPLAGLPFWDCWQKLVRDCDSRRSELMADECRSCAMNLLCANCPAWSEIETGSLNKKADYICEYTRCLEKKYFQQKEGMGHGQEALSKA